MSLVRWQAAEDLEPSELFFDYSTFIASFKILGRLITTPSDKEGKFV